MDVMNPRETGTTAANRIALPLPRSNAALDEQPDLIDLATPERGAEPMRDALRATEPEAVPTIETPDPAGHE